MEVISCQATITEALVVDDQKITSETRVMVQRSCGYSVLAAENDREALRLLLKDTPLRLVISELSIAMMSRFELISGIRWRLPSGRRDTSSKPCCTNAGHCYERHVYSWPDSEHCGCFHGNGRESAEVLASMLDRRLSTCTATLGRLQARIPATGVRRRDLT